MGPPAAVCAAVLPVAVTPQRRADAFGGLSPPTSTRRASAPRLRATTADLTLGKAGSCGRRPRPPACDPRSRTRIAGRGLGARACGICCIRGSLPGLSGVWRSPTPKGDSQRPLTLPPPTGSGAGAYSWQRPSLVGSLTGPLHVSASATTRPRSTPTLLPCRSSSRPTVAPPRAALRNRVVGHPPAVSPHMTARRGHRQSSQRPPARGGTCVWGGRPGGHVKQAGAANRRRETVPPACNGPQAHCSRGVALNAIATERPPRK